MSRRTKFKLEPGFEAALAKSEIARKSLVAPSKRVEATAKKLTRRRSGKMAEGITAEAPIITPRGWIARVVGRDWKTGFYEFGTSRIRAERMLARALEKEVGPLQGGRRR